MIGWLVSGRYRIEAVVGTGGMAVVYRAYDTLENRIVAIKVLRPEYESDMEFVRRFSREAEAAAKVSHENIVNLLDVGIDDDVRYIVMEYVDGVTLKEMIRREGRIHPDVALRMTIRILAAVDHAHRNGIVHRDIKPQNILVDQDGRVRVADFGIARLKAAQTTQLDPNGNAMGSVHYLSPEQAQGQVADEQSDLYSVGVVMYEMLTGHVPFDGETSVSVALKHLSEEPKSMRELNGKISKAMDEVVMRALCKDKKKRYQTAAEMAADLRKTISHPKGGFVRYPKDKDEPKSSKEKKNRDAKPRTKRRISAAVWIIAAMLIVVVILGVTAYVRRQKENVPMPQLIGMEEGLAVLALDEIGISSTIVNAYSEDYTRGVVMLQSRNVGDSVRKDSNVTLTVSLGSQWYYLEDMTGWPAAEALSALRKSGAVTVSMVYIQSDQPVDSVVSLNCAPGWVSKDTPVVVQVSGQSVSVPSLSGLTLEGARKVIEAEGLVLGEVTEGESADAESGTVIAQSVAPYTLVLTNTAVDLTICRAHETSYAPASSLMVVVPLENLRAVVNLVTPSGQTIEAYAGNLPAGSHMVELKSSEPGLHGVYIYMDEILMEAMQLNFE